MVWLVPKRMQLPPRWPPPSSRASMGELQREALRKQLLLLVNLVPRALKPKLRLPSPAPKRPKLPPEHLRLVVEPIVLHAMRVDLPLSLPHKPKLLLWGACPNRAVRPVELRWKRKVLMADDWQVALELQPSQVRAELSHQPT